MGIYGNGVNVIGPNLVPYGTTSTEYDESVVGISANLSNGGVGVQGIDWQ